MTPRQRHRYWARLRATWALLSSLGSPDSFEEFRRDLHLDALGADRSSSTFSNRDLDRVFAALDTLDLLANPIPPGDRLADQPARRLRYVIRSIGLPEPYIAEIARDKFGSSDWSSLAEPQLRQLLYTLRARARLHPSQPSAIP